MTVEQEAVAMIATEFAVAPASKTTECVTEAFEDGLARVALVTGDDGVIHLTTQNWTTEWATICRGGPEPEDARFIRINSVEHILLRGVECEGCFRLAPDMDHPCGCIEVTS